MTIEELYRRGDAKSLPAFSRPVRLTAREKARADRSLLQHGRPIVIISRPFHEGARRGHVVSAVYADDGSVVAMGNGGITWVRLKSMVPVATRDTARWLDKLALGGMAASRSRDRAMRRGAR